MKAHRDKLNTNPSVAKKVVRRTLHCSRCKPHRGENKTGRSKTAATHICWKVKRKIKYKKLA